MTIVEVFVPNAYFSVTASMTPQQKMLRWRRCERLFEPTLRGCSSVVEHLLAKEDVASSSLVTRSNSLGGTRARRVSSFETWWRMSQIRGHRSHFLESEL